MNQQEHITSTVVCKIQFYLLFGAMLYKISNFGRR